MPGPRETPIQCFIRRDRATANYRLYLGLTPALSDDRSKLLLAARKIRRATSTAFHISFVGGDFSRTSNAYAGKLRSNFLGTKFTIYDNWHQHQSVQSNGKQLWKIHSTHASPWMTDRNRDVGTVSYELNVLRTRGPRRMLCTMHSIPISAIQEGGTAPTPQEFEPSKNERQLPNLSELSIPKARPTLSESSPDGLVESVCGRNKPLVLKNKAPRWHQQLQCWCPNFKGRVTVASVKNFQLVAGVVEASENIMSEEQERVILQFGKIGKEIFTMDYRYPLSAIQSFAICLSSFDTKPACE